jgi:hypothetical protein
LVLIDQTPRGIEYRNTSLKPLIRKYFHVSGPYLLPETDLLSYLDHIPGSDGKRIGRRRLVLRVAELSSFLFSPVVALKVDRRDKLDVSDFEVLIKDEIW